MEWKPVTTTNPYNTLNVYESTGKRGTYRIIEDGTRARLLLNDIQLTGWLASRKYCAKYAEEEEAK